MSYYEEKIFYNQISFRYAKGKSIRNGNEIHSYHEILYYIDGGATLLTADFKEELSPGTFLIIPKEMYHNLHIKHQEKYARLVITFPDLDIIKNITSCAMSEIRIIKNINENISCILNRMCSIICDKENANTEIFLYGAFLSLICEIYFDVSNALIPTMRKKEQLITRVLDYIEDNYTCSICVNDIAKKMFVSSSTLFQCFKNEMGVSLYKYVTEKRLIYARKLISHGENPTKIFKECGFSDYSSFYKAYKKMFSLSPSDDKKTLNK